MAKLTEEELRKIIQEEIKDIDEATLAQYLARLRGKASQGKTFASNIGKGIGDLVKKSAAGSEKFTPSRFADPKEIRRLTGAKSILDNYMSKLDTIGADMVEDFNALSDVGISTSGMESIVQKLQDAVNKMKAQSDTIQKKLDKEKGE